MQDQQSQVEWRGRDVPVSPRFDDPYFSLQDGLAETTHVFLHGNGLPGRFRPGFHVAELGFGTGLNLLATLDLWRRSGQAGTLRFTSFEAFPLTAPDMMRAQGAFPDLSAIAAELAPFWRAGDMRITLPDLEFTLVPGDARVTLPTWEGRADAWYLDGFSPAKNPELWQPSLMKAVADHTVPGGRAATYTAAGFVRRGLQTAGFAVTRSQGYGRKRHMTTAIKPVEGQVAQ